MKKHLAIIGILFSTVLVSGVSATTIQDGFEEDTVVSNLVIEQTSIVGFDEEDTVVENLSSTQNSSSTFSEEDTVVGDQPSVQDPSSTFDEEDTVVGNPDTTVTPPTETDTNTSSRGRSGSRRSTATAPTGNLSSGEVLGASTDSCAMLTTFMKIGTSNNVEEVKMLQTFLNSKINASLPVTGFFGPLTFQAIKDFQAQYAEDILKPWVEAGLMEDEIPTGYVYKTTQHAINKMLCPEAEIAYPVLN
jgi:hypothetical protein